MTAMRPRGKPIPVINFHFYFCHFSLVCVFLSFNVHFSRIWGWYLNSFNFDLPFILVRILIALNFPENTASSHAERTFVKMLSFLVAFPFAPGGSRELSHFLFVQPENIDWNTSILQILFRIPI